MTVHAFLTVAEQAISLRQAMAYLQTSGDLNPFLLKILQQHFLEQEMERRLDLKTDPIALDQAMMAFRLQNKLLEQSQFTEWLKSSDLTYEIFRDRIAGQIKMAQLKDALTKERVETFFQDNQALLEQVVLSRIVVESATLAQELHQQISANPQSFGTLAKTHSIAPEKAVNGFMGSLPLGQLAPVLREVVQAAQPGDTPTPIPFEDRFILLKIEEKIPAVLEGNLQQRLQEQMLNQWLQEKTQGVTIQMHLGENTGQATSGDPLLDLSPQA